MTITTTYVGCRNRYTCGVCEGSIITIDRDDGVTPFLIDCKATRSCSGLMRSEMYRDVYGKATYEWRRPTPDELVGMSSAMRQHVKAGGLDLYKL